MLNIVLYYLSACNYQFNYGRIFYNGHFIFNSVVELDSEKTNKISVDDLKKRMGNKEKMFLLDARDLTAYFKGHIPGACSLFDGNIMPVESKVDKDAMVIVYGPGQAQSSKNPMDRLAGDAIDRLKKIGLTKVMELAGGFEAWANAGNQVEAANPESIKPVDYTAISRSMGM
jgi:rhodanese-related sulfurtransferase